MKNFQKITVTSLNLEKGFGFGKTEDNKSVFFHKSSFSKKEWENLKVGYTFIAELEETQKGFTAKPVKIRYFNSESLLAAIDGETIYYSEETEFLFPEYMIQAYKEAESKKKMVNEVLEIVEVYFNNIETEKIEIDSKILTNPITEVNALISSLDKKEEMLKKVDQWLKEFNPKAVLVKGERHIISSKKFEELTEKKEKFIEKFIQIRHSGNSVFYRIGLKGREISYMTDEKEFFIFNHPILLEVLEEKEIERTSLVNYGISDDGLRNEYRNYGKQKVYRCRVKYPNNLIIVHEDLREVIKLPEISEDIISTDNLPQSEENFEIRLK